MKNNLPFNCECNRFDLLLFLPISIAFGFVHAMFAYESACFNMFVLIVYLLCFVYSLNRSLFCLFCWNLMRSHRKAVVTVNYMSLFIVNEETNIMVISCWCLIALSAKKSFHLTAHTNNTDDWITAISIPLTTIDLILSVL